MYIHSFLSLYHYNDIAHVPWRDDTFVRDEPVRARRMLSYGGDAKRSENQEGRFAAERIMLTYSERGFFSEKGGEGAPRSCVAWCVVFSTASFIWLLAVHIKSPTKSATIMLCRSTESFGLIRHSLCAQCIVALSEIVLMSMSPTMTRIGFVCEYHIINALMPVSMIRY